MSNNVDYIALMDIAKMNLANKINLTRARYKLNPTKQLKNELIELTSDRKELFMFNTEVIKKYL